MGDPRDHPHHRFELHASRSDGGRKPIAKVHGMAIEPVGAFRAAGQPRAAVVFAKRRPHVEATSDCRIVVVGVHTEDGFRPSKP